MSVTVTLKVKSYIAHPFWPEQKTLIEIQKKSGMNLTRGETKRKAALKAELDKRQLTEADYESLQKLSCRPFHTLDGEGWIYIPSRNFESFLAHVAHVCPRAMRAVTPQNAHSSTVVVAPGLVTNRQIPDGEFTRFVKLEMSNERSLQSNAFIADFMAIGKMELSDNVNRHDLRRMIEWGGQELGLGASRSQGYGRFTVVEFQPS